MLGIGYWILGLECWRTNMLYCMLDIGP